MTQHTNLIIGPPGCGKTTSLLDILEKELASGISPDKIAFISFTKKSVEEAIDRACDRFSFVKSDLVYFRTIHSLAFMLMGLKKTDVMQAKDYTKIGNHLGLRFNCTRSFEDFAPASRNPGDQYSFIDSFSRARKIEPMAVWDTVDHDGLNWWEYLRYVDTVSDYKRSRNLTDFTDMLSCRSEPLSMEVCIIDEAQDLSTSQWDFIDHTFSKTKRIYIAGDDDQAIFEWSGADIRRFANLKGERTVLHQSYRIPKEVHSFATDITSKIKGRIDKDYLPRDSEGVVEHWGDVDSIDMSSGTWLLLARNGYLLSELAACVKNGGYKYTLKNMDSVSKADVRMIQLWERKRGGLKLTSSETLSLESYTSNVHSNKIWHEAFDKLEAEVREYYVSLLRRGESLTAPARITLSTIHGSKGGEADNVVLLTDMARSTWDSVPMNRASEYRVWYVGATRAKNTLNIVRPRGRYHVDL